MRINCPFCIDRVQKEDTSQTMYIDRDRGAYLCFRCGAKPSITGAFDKVFKKYAVNREVQKMAQSTQDLKEKLISLSSYRKTTFDLDAISVPISLVDTPMAYEYMRDRGFTPEELQKYKIRVGMPKRREDRRWSGRILFPYYDSRGDCTYIVARSHVGHTNKYMNTKADKDKIVYFLDQVKDSTCIICEGIVSAIAASRHAPYQAVAVLGKSIKEEQARAIRRKCSRVIICLDGDVNSEFRARMARTLFKTGFQIEEITLPIDKDPDDLGEKFLEYFTDRKPLTLSSLSPSSLCLLAG